MNIINMFFTLVIFLIIARVFLSYMGQSYGKFYNFVYKYSEYILKPIRNKLPYSSGIDWSPLVALIGINLIRSIILFGWDYLMRGDIISFIIVIIITSINFISSMLILYAFLVIAKMFINYTGAGYGRFAYVIKTVTEPVLKIVRKQLPMQYKKYTDIIAIVLLFAIRYLLVYLTTFLGSSYLM